MGLQRSTRPTLMASGGVSAGAASVAGFAGPAENGEVAHRVLIVEDEFLTSWHLSDMMSGLGFDVVGVSATGEDAVRLAAETEPDVILMDVSLKGEMDGVEAARAISGARPAAIIFVSAYTDDETVERMSTVERSHRVVKPVGCSDLRSVLSAALGGDDD